MAFAFSGLKTTIHGGAVGSGANSVRSIHHYATNDDAAAVEAAGYFNTAFNELKAGDVIVVSGDLDGTVFTKSYVVTASTASSVAIAPESTGRVYLPYFINQTDLLAGTVADIGPAPVAGRITGHRTVVQVAVTTGGTLTPAINGTPLTGGVVTVANSSTKGTRLAGTAITAANTIAAGDRIGITPASFATAGAVNGVIEITLSAAA